MSSITSSNSIQTNNIDTISGTTTLNIGGTNVTTIALNEPVTASGTLAVTGITTATGGLRVGDISALTNTGVINIGATRNETGINIGKTIPTGPITLNSNSIYPVKTQNIDSLSSTSQLQIGYSQTTDSPVVIGSLANPDTVTTLQSFSTIIEGTLFHSPSIASVDGIDITAPTGIKLSYTIDPTEVFPYSSYIETNSTLISNTINFHSNAEFENTYDSRIVASGGTTDDGKGTLGISAKTINIGDGIAGTVTNLMSPTTLVDGILQTTNILSGTGIDVVAPSGIKLSYTTDPTEVLPYSAYIETNSTTTSNTINFHSNAEFENTYDSSIVASGGTTDDGEGTLALTAKTVQINGALTMGTGKNIILQPTTGYVAPVAGQLGFTNSASNTATPSSGSNTNVCQIAVTTAGVYIVTLNLTFPVGTSVQSYEFWINTVSSSSTGRLGAMRIAVPVTTLTQRYVTTAVFNTTVASTFYGIVLRDTSTGSVAGQIYATRIA